MYTNFNADLTSNKCDLKIVQNSQELTQNEAVEYKLDATPKVTNLSPVLGPTNGNTALTITGQNFSNCQVFIDDIECAIQSSTTTSISCLTGARPTYTESQLKVQCDTGFAMTQNNSFLYIDRWSESQTWGGELPPVEGESVHIPKGQTLLVDVSPPKLNLVTIEGTMMFEDV